MMTQKPIIALNNLRDYLIQENLRIKELEHYLYDVQYMHKAFDAEEAIDVVLKLFNHMNKVDRHNHHPAFHVVVKFLCTIK